MKKNPAREMKWFLPERGEEHEAKVLSSGPGKLRGIPVSRLARPGPKMFLVLAG